MTVDAMSRRVDAITLPSPTMMTRLTLLCAAVALGVGSNAAAALPSASPTAVTRDVAAATITGHVTDATGRPLANAQVFVVNSQLRALTTADGRYSITGVPTGTSVTLTDETAPVTSWRRCVP